MKVIIKPLFTYCHGIRKKLNYWLVFHFPPWNTTWERPTVSALLGGNWLTAKGGSDNRFLSFYGVGARRSRDT